MFFSSATVTYAEVGKLAGVHAGSDTSLPLTPSSHFLG